MGKKITEILKELENNIIEINTWKFYTDQKLAKIDEMYNTLFPERSTYYVPDYERCIGGMKKQDLDRELNQIRNLLFELRDELTREGILKY
jgi:hypothetical protein